MPWQGQAHRTLDDRGVKMEELEDSPSDEELVLYTSTYEGGNACELSRFLHDCEARFVPGLREDVLVRSASSHLTGPARETVRLAFERDRGLPWEAFKDALWREVYPDEIDIVLANNEFLRAQPRPGERRADWFLRLMNLHRSLHPSSFFKTYEQLCQVFLASLSRNDLSYVKMWGISDDGPKSIADRLDDAFSKQNRMAKKRRARKDVCRPGRATHIGIHRVKLRPGLASSARALA